MPSEGRVERLRIKPDNDNARIYVVSKPVVMCVTAPCPQPEPGSMRLERRSSNQVLHKAPEATCLAMPSCNSGEVASETESGCLQDIPCREVAICGKTIFCSKTD